MRRASSANHSTYAAPEAISPRASASGLPCSVVRMSARSSTLAIMSSYQRRRMTLRSFAVLARHAGHAASAASIARRVSAAPMSGTVPTSCPVAGLDTRKVAPLSASVQAPLMYACCRSSEASLRSGVKRSMASGMTTSGETVARMCADARIIGAAPADPAGAVSLSGLFLVPAHDAERGSAEDQHAEGDAIPRERHEIV